MLKQRQSDIFQAKCFAIFLLPGEPRVVKMFDAMQCIPTSCL